MKQYAKLNYLMILIPEILVPKLARLNPKDVVFKPQKIKEKLKQRDGL